ncbi:MAG: serine hydrolase [Acidobacteriaceae bacterium]
MVRLSSLLIQVVLIAASALPAAAQSTPQPPSRSLDIGKLERFVPLPMQTWKVPGVAIAVVQNGRVIYAHGFGVRDVKDNLPVTSKTLFAIGSTTKSFTSVCIGILNDEGELDWDKPVRQYLPEFQLYDPVAAERMTPRDLISHRSGLAAHDLVWYSSDFSREDLVRRLRYLRSNSDFRSGFHYNNMLVMTAGYLVGKVSGQGWEAFVRTHLFQPLQMTASNFSVTDSQKAPDFAHPYRKNERTEVVSEAPFRPIDSIGPAGSINSNIDDMARYLIFQLGKGEGGGHSIISEANLNLTHTPQVVISGGGQFKEIGPPGYGMGWVISSYRGHKLVWHNGGIDGFYALLSMLPDENLGVVILTNLQNQPVPEIIAYDIFDNMLGLDQVDWSDRYHQLEAKQKAAEEGAKKAGVTSRKSGTHPSHDLQDYVGHFENPGYGTLTIRSAENGFVGKLNEISFPLQHYHYDVFEVPENAAEGLSEVKLRFLTNMDGDIDSIAAPLEDAAPEIVFTRVAEKLPREALLPLIGDYQIGTMTVSIALKKDELQMIVPGQPINTLVPQQGLKFAVKGSEGFSVEFRKDAAGAVDSLVIFQPEGTFMGNRKAGPSK